MKFRLSVLLLVAGFLAIGCRNPKSDFSREEAAATTEVKQQLQSKGYTLNEEPKAFGSIDPDTNSVTVFVLVPVTKTVRSLGEGGYTRTAKMNCKCSITTAASCTCNELQMQHYHRRQLHVW
ncbi:MAG: hypothetical protein PHT12_02890 [Patescibacteria group bacterium]|nr:hypothetical protein [Patescibacteria group bacterium]